ncbi:unnamed protein product [Prunus armeniaca]
MSSWSKVYIGHSSAHGLAIEWAKQGSNNFGRSPAPFQKDLAVNPSAKFELSKTRPRLISDNPGHISSAIPTANSSYLRIAQLRLTRPSFFPAVPSCFASLALPTNPGRTFSSSPDVVDFLTAPNIAPRFVKLGIGAECHDVLRVLDSNLVCFTIFFFDSILHHVCRMESIPSDSGQFFEDMKVAMEKDLGKQVFAYFLNAFPNSAQYILGPFFSAYPEEVAKTSHGRPFGRAPSHSNVGRQEPPPNWIPLQLKRPHQRKLHPPPGSPTTQAWRMASLIGIIGSRRWNQN